MTYTVDILNHIKRKTEIWNPCPHSRASVYKSMQRSERPVCSAPEENPVFPELGLVVRDDGRHDEVTIVRGEWPRASRS